MSKKQRIAELERRVAELEARERSVCSACGTYYLGMHTCWTVAQPGTWESDPANRTTTFWYQTAGVN